jgi:hypothetical protein
LCGCLHDLKWFVLHICRVGQNHIYTVHTQNLWQGNHQIYGHIQCIYTYIRFWPTLPIYGVHAVILAGKSPNIRPYTAHIYDYGHPYLYTVCAEFMAGKAPNIRPYTVHKYDSGQPYTCAYVGRTRGWYRGCCCCAGAGATYKLHANEVSH